MIKYLNYILLVQLIGLILPCNAQQTFTDFPYEKIIIQTDRDVYVPGETLWFKADYLLNGRETDRLLSKVIYVELIALNGEVISRAKYENPGKMVEGNIEIIEGLASGYYIIRAYTQYQRNFKPDNYATKYITLINPSLALKGYDNEKDTLFEFAGISREKDSGFKTKIALRVDPRISRNIKNAYIVTQYIDTIASVKLAENGLGIFNLPNVDSLNYFLQLTMKNGKLIKKELPDSYHVEYHLDSKFENNVLFVKFDDSSLYCQKNKEKLRLKIYSKAHYLLHEMNVDPGNNWQAINTDLDSGNHGLLYLVVTAEDDQPVSVKAVLNQTLNPISIKILKNKHTYTPREKVSLKLISPELQESNIENISVSVVKHGSIENSNDISDIVIENPVLIDDYLRYSALSNEILEQTNILLALYSQQLLKSNFYNLKLKEVKNDINWLPENRGITLSGKVIDKTSGVPLNGVDVYISTIGDNPQLHIYTTNQQGEFISTLKHVSGPLSVFLCIRDANEENMEILVNSDYSNEIPTYRNTTLVFDTSAVKFIESLYVNAQLNRHYHSESAKKVSIDTIKPIRFINPNISVKLDDYIPLPTLQDVIDELVPYVRVRKEKDEYYFELFDEKTQLTFNDPLILLDNLPVFNVNELLKIDPASIEHIGVINNTIVYGDHLLKGIVMIASNTDNYANIELPLSSTFLEFNATTPNEKYLPDINRKIVSKRTPDFRNMLYWNPEVFFEGQETNVSFYTSDDVGQYDVVVRGLTLDGKPIYTMNQFIVK